VAALVLCRLDYVNGTPVGLPYLFRRLRSVQYVTPDSFSDFIVSTTSLTLSSTSNLLVPAVKLSTVGRRAFLVAGARIWIDLPPDVTSSLSLLTFTMHLCTYFTFPIPV